MALNRSEHESPFPSSSNTYAYGGEEKMEITANIINKGEDAFNAMLYLQLPKEINYMSAESNTPGLSVLCSPPSPMNNHTLQCDIGNPLPANTQVSYLFPSFYVCLPVSVKKLWNSLVDSHQTFPLDFLAPLVGFRPFLGTSNTFPDFFRRKVEKS